MAGPRIKPIHEPQTVSLSLTRRQEQILGLLCTGKSMKEIGADLGITSSTVKNYCAMMRMKFQARTTSELVAAYVSGKIKMRGGAA